MTLTITLPDDATGRIKRAAEARGLDLPAFAVALMVEAGEASKPAETDSRAPIDLMAFAGVGHGRPGAVSVDGTDVVAYLRAMRDEWDEGEDDQVYGSQGDASFDRAA